MFLGLKRHLFLFVTFFSSQTSWAGEQLTAIELTQRASAIAEISVKWTENDDATPELTIDKWYKKPDDKTLNNIQGKTELTQKWVGLCLPDASLLKHWVKSYPHFEKENVEIWKTALTQRQYSSIVFLKPHPSTGQLRPTCEAEALLVQGWKSHPKIRTYLKQVIRNLVRPRKTKLPPKTANTNNRSQPATKNQEKQGCSCRSSL